MRPSSLLDRLEPGSYHSKALAAEALKAYVGQRRAPRPPWSARRRAYRRQMTRQAARQLRRRASWRYVAQTVRTYVSTDRRNRAQEAAAAVCAERGHVTYRPDPSCRPASCARCVRCDYEHHTRGGRA